MTKAKKEKLRECARLASKGPWSSFENGPWGGQGFGVHIPVMKPNGEEAIEEWFVVEANTSSAAQNALYIGEADPTTMLELLDKLDKLEAKLERTKDHALQRRIEEDAVEQAVYDELLEAHDKLKARLEAAEEIANARGQDCNEVYEKLLAAKKALE